MAPKRKLDIIYPNSNLNFDYNNINPSSKRRRLNNNSYTNVDNNHYIFISICYIVINNEIGNYYIFISCYIVMNDENRNYYISCSVIIFRISIMHFNINDSDDDSGYNSDCTIASCESNISALTFDSKS